MYLINGKGSIIRLIAGSFILMSIFLSKVHSENWLILTGLVGSMLILSATIGFCPMEIFLKASKLVKVKTLVDSKSEELTNE